MDRASGLDLLTVFRLATPKFLTWVLVGPTVLVQLPDQVLAYSSISDSVVQGRRSRRGGGRWPRRRDVDVAGDAPQAVEAKATKVPSAHVQARPWTADACRGVELAASAMSLAGVRDGGRLSGVYSWDPFPVPVKHVHWSTNSCRKSPVDNDGQHAQARAARCGALAEVMAAVTSSVGGDRRK
jgi:hypothetical protein